MKGFIMKKFMVAIAIAFAFFAGFATKGFTPEWDYQRGIGQTEVRADYDLAIGEDVYYEIVLWDKEYKECEVVERGICHKDALNELSETAGLYEQVFMAGYHR